MKKNDKHPSDRGFDFNGAEQRYSQSHDTLDHFCIDEMMAYFVLGWDDTSYLEDTPENRRSYYNTLRNHLTKLGIKKMNINIKK